MFGKNHVEVSNFCPTYAAFLPSDASDQATCETPSSNLELASYIRRLKRWSSNFVTNYTMLICRDPSTSKVPTQAIHGKIED